MAIPSTQTQAYLIGKHPLYPSGDWKAVAAFAHSFQSWLSEVQLTTLALISWFYCTCTCTVKDRSNTFANWSNYLDCFPRWVQLLVLPYLSTWLPRPFQHIFIAQIPDLDIAEVFSVQQTLSLLISSYIWFNSINRHLLLFQQDFIWPVFLSLHSPASLTSSLTDPSSAASTQKEFCY